MQKSPSQKGDARKLVGRKLPGAEEKPTTHRHTVTAPPHVWYSRSIPGVESVKLASTRRRSRDGLTTLMSQGRACWVVSWNWACIEMMLSNSLYLFLLMWGRVNGPIGRWKHLCWLTCHVAVVFLIPPVMLSNKNNDNSYVSRRPMDSSMKKISTTTTITSICQVVRCHGSYLLCFSYVWLQRRCRVSTQTTWWKCS